MLTSTVARAGILLVAFAVTPVAGQTIKVSRPSLMAENRTNLQNQTIVVRPAINVTIGGTPRPDASIVLVRSKWVAVAYSPAHLEGMQVPIADVIVEPGTEYRIVGLLRLQFAEPLANDVTRVDVVPLFPDGKPVTWTPAEPEGRIGIFEVEKKDDADVYLFGSWLTGIDSSPIYNLDFVVGAPSVDFMFRSSPWLLTAEGALKTADERKLNPDSYEASLTLQPRFPRPVGGDRSYLMFEWQAARAEFSAEDEELNLVSAPTVTYSKTLVAALRDDKTVKAVIDADISGGIETGRNLRDKLVPGGYGAILRFVPGVGVHAAFPGALGMKEVRWTTTYKARLLAQKEAFTDTRDDDNPFPSVARGTRHEWKDQLDFKVTPILAVTISHDYGSTPPAFKILNHRVSAGVTVMWGWRG